MPVLSSGAGSNFHFLMASMAAFTSSGCPPTTLVLFRFPLGATTTRTLTVPVMLMRRATSGYTGATLVFVLRVSSSWAWADCVCAVRGENEAPHVNVKNVRRLL